MNEFINEIKSTLKEEKSNNFDSHQDEDYNKEMDLEETIKDYTLKEC